MKKQVRKFEHLVSEAFKLAGYNVSETGIQDIGYDFILELNKKQEFAVELKYYKSKHPQTSLIAAAASRLLESLQNDQVEKAILVVSCQISADLRHSLESKYKITFVDRVDLLVMTANDTDLHDKIRSMLDGDEYIGGKSKDSIIKKIRDSKVKITG